MKEEQKKTASSSEETQTPSRWKAFLKKKWFFPAVYLGAAALILAVIFWYQNPNDYAIDSDQLDPNTTDFESAVDHEWDDVYGQDGDSVPVTSTSEKMAWPVAQDEDVQVVLSYFDDNAAEEDLVNAMVEYDGSFYPSQGISLSRADNEPFDVLAALSGTVILADKEPLMGYVVEIEHENGLVTAYQSLSEVNVEVGDEVAQGEKIGVAGNNEFHKELGVHVHFEVRENGVAVNPDVYLSQAE
jgi:stage II sporulation protein Q